jgi:hypothetical protein
VANLLKNLARSLVSNAATAYVTAANPGTPNNQRITIKRIKVTNISAATTVLTGLWAGSAADDAHVLAKGISLGAGESLEFDPTTVVLEPGENLYAQGSIANNLQIAADGLRQTE